MLTALLAVLIPGVPLADQPHIDPPPVVEVWHVRDDVPGPRSGPIRPAPVRPDPPAAPTPHTPSDGVTEPWASLADCESGKWIDSGAAFVAGSARWTWGHPDVPVPPWGTRIHHGGLQFHPDTWAWVAPDVLTDPPRYAYDATPAQQVAVAVEVRARQGWPAWPVCSRLLGLR